MIRRMSGRFHNLKRKIHGPECFRISCDQTVKILSFNRRITVFAFPEEGQDLTETPGQTAGAAAGEGVLPFLQAFDCLWMQDDLCRSDSENIIQESCMIIMGMG